MGDVRSRWANEPGHNRGLKPAPPGEPCATGIGLFRWPAMLVLAVVFLLGTMAVTAAAQDEPPKVDAPEIGAAATPGHTDDAGKRTAGCPEEGIGARREAEGRPDCARRPGKGKTGSDRA